MKNKGISKTQLEKDIKKGIYYAQNSTKCSYCGHSMLIGRKDKIICSWCKHWIFKDKKQEFLYRMGEMK